MTCRPYTDADARFEVAVEVAALDILPWPTRTAVETHVYAEGIQYV